MNLSGRGLVQVAGVRDAAEARLLDSLGADLIGFPLRLAVHAPDTSEEEAAEIVREAGVAGKAVLITYETDPAELAGMCTRLQARCVQLHADISPEATAAFRRLAPEVAVIKSLIVGRGDVFEQARRFEGAADAFLTDTFDPASGATGATGRIHDWSVSARLVRECGRPVILAGGLNPENVAEAVRTVRPAGVDAHTGLEDAAGAKDQRLVSRFIAGARAAFWERA